MATSEQERPSLWEEILWERVAQDADHGGPDNDDLLTFSEWIGVLTQFAGRAFACARLGRGDLYRARLVQVAAVAVAALDAFDRANPSSPVVLGQLRAGPDTAPSPDQPEPVAESYTYAPTPPECPGGT
jgi:hypothetical protein